MTDAVDRRTLDQTPNASDIASYREEAAEHDVSIEATYTPPDGAQKRLVVSPRGTVVLLNDVSEETFNQSRSADEIATALQEKSTS